MNLHETSLLATFKTVSAFGVKYAADFPATGIGGKQFALVTAAVPQTGTLGATQVSGADLKNAGLKSKAVAYKSLHDDLAAIADAAHSLALLNLGGGAVGDGMFVMPRSGGDQALLNTARAFQTDAAPLAAQFVSVGLDTDFLTQLDTHISDFEAAIAEKKSGQTKEGGATGGIDDTTHQAAIALHVLNTVVRNKYKNDPIKLAEWVIASHVEKHTPVPRAKPAATTAPAK